MQNSFTSAEKAVISEQEDINYENGVSSFGYSFKTNDQGLIFGKTIYGNIAIKNIETLDPKSATNSRKQSSSALRKLKNGGGTERFKPDTTLKKLPQ